MHVISASTLTWRFDHIASAVPGIQGLHWQPLYGETGLDLVAVVD